jgi:hypothetical protein
MRKIQLQTVAKMQSFGDVKQVFTTGNTGCGYSCTLTRNDLKFMEMMLI